MSFVAVDIVEHKASLRRGVRVSMHRRHGTEGAWVMWPEGRRPTWHPAEILTEVPLSVIYVDLNRPS